jgi:1-deoxy-D-xylulose-5-phosphate synthase
MVEIAKEAREILKTRGINASIANMRFVKPIDIRLLNDWKDTKKIFATLEENVLAGGFGSAISEWMHDNNVNLPLIRFGIGDNFIPAATRAELFEMLSLTGEQVADKIESYVRR